MRPTIKILSDELIQKIISEAIEILCKLGLEIHNKKVLSMLSDCGCAVDMEKSHVVLTSEIIEKALKTAPASFGLYDVAGKQTHDFSGDNVYFTPGSTALNILDSHERKMRKAVTADYVNFVKVTEQLDNIASTSTALISADVPEDISDSYRLYLSLLYGSKPVVTGAFTIESFEVMKDFQLAVRGTSEALKEKPLTIFSCCPTSPLKWCEVTSQNLLPHLTSEMVRGHFAKPAGLRKVLYSCRVYRHAIVRIHGAGNADRNPYPAYSRNSQRYCHQPDCQSRNTHPLRRIASHIRYPA